MADAQHENEKSLIDDFADQTVVSDPVFPEFAELRALECLAQYSRIFRSRHTVLKEF